MNDLLTCILSTWGGQVRRVGQVGEQHSCAQSKAS